MSVLEFRENGILDFILIVIIRNINEINDISAHNNNSNNSDLLNKSNDLQEHKKIFIYFNYYSLINYIYAFLIIFHQLKHKKQLLECDCVRVKNEDKRKNISLIIKDHLLNLIFIALFVKHKSLIILLFIGLEKLLEFKFKNISIGSRLLITEYLTKFIFPLIHNFSYNYNNDIEVDTDFFLKKTFTESVIIIVFVSILIYNAFNSKKFICVLIGACNVICGILLISQEFTGIIMKINQYYKDFYNINISRREQVSHQFNIKYHSYLILYWVSCLLLIVVFEMLNKIFHFKRLIKRKLFHLLAILIFIPPIIYSDTIIRKDFLCCVSVLAIFCFLLLEILRNRYKEYFLFTYLNEYLLENIDDRDSKDFIFTHTFLLFGCISSYLLSFMREIKFEYNEPYLNYYDLSLNTQVKYILGLVILGVGDSFASIVGILYGKTKIYSPTNKTLEGSLGALLFSLIFIYLITLDSNCIKCKSNYNHCINEFY